MRILQEISDGPSDCSYLPDRQSTMQYRLAVDLAPNDYEQMMGQGFRKFGHLLFRPDCQDCQACQPLRLLIGEFVPDRSMKRCLAGNEDLELQIDKATPSVQKTDLYNRYHAMQIERKEWNPVIKIKDVDYFNHFLQSELLIEEISIFCDQQLVGILLFEELPRGISLIYHFYDLNFRQRGLGTYLILKAIELAKKRNKEFVYLGYFVSGAKSMHYKAKFKPHQLLKGGVWRDPTPIAQS